MDGTSPGNVPTSLGNVRVGETKWFGAGVVCGGGILPFGREPALGANAACAAPQTFANMFGEHTPPNWAACGCYVGPWLGTDQPPRCPAHAGTTAVPLTPFVNPLLDQRKPLSADPSDWYHKFSDADVERIARRVVELLAARGAGTPP